jgi:capsular polysaccharide biosynthesis protein
MGFDPHTIKYIVPTNTPEFAFKWLAFLGISNQQIIRFNQYDEIVGATRLIVPTLLRTNGRAHELFRSAVEYLFALIRGRHSLARNGYDRVFLSRRLANREGRLLVNRQKIERMAAEAGFAIINPERLSIVDQISLFTYARQIIGEYGSALHGSMFSSPGTFVCAFRADAIHPGFLQSGICQTMHQRIGYVFGETECNDVEQKFSVTETDCELALRILKLGQDNRC